MTTSVLAARRGAQTPRVAKYPAYVSSAAPEFVDLAASAGLLLDPWQRYVLTHGLGEQVNGQWASFKNSVWVPRQNGKGAIIEALELGWLFLTRERLILHSAHEYKTAQEAFLRVKSLIEQTPDLDRRVNRYWQANGEQGIELVRSAGGGRLRFVARSRTSGRGFSGDKNVLDEAQELTGQQMAALLPTMSARPNPQLWFFGTPPSDPAAWVYGLRADGSAGVDRMAHFDWGADLDVSDHAAVTKARTDRDLWYACNPALGMDRADGSGLREEFVADEATDSGLGDNFVIERLGAWLPPLGSGSVIAPEAWSALAEPPPEPADLAPIAIAVDVTPERSHAAIAVAGRFDGLIHVELAEHRRGTSWVADRLLELVDRYEPCAVIVDAGGPAGSLIADIEALGIEVVKPAVRDVVQACGAFVDAVAPREGAPTLRHAGQAPLDDAVKGAARTNIGDGGWKWSRQHTSVNIAPLVAVTLAAWGRSKFGPGRDYEILDSVY